MSLPDYTDAPHVPSGSDSMKPAYNSLLREPSSRMPSGTTPDTPAERRHLEGAGESGIRTGCGACRKLMTQSRTRSNEADYTVQIVARIAKNPASLTQHTGTTTYSLPWFGCADHVTRCGIPMTLRALFGKPFESPLQRNVTAQIATAILDWNRYTMKTRLYSITISEVAEDQNAQFTAIVHNLSNNTIHTPDPFEYGPQERVLNDDPDATTYNAPDRDDAIQDMFSWIASNFDGPGA